MFPTTPPDQTIKSALIIEHRLYDCENSPFVHLIVFTYPLIINLRYLGLRHYILHLSSNSIIGTNETAVSFCRWEGNCLAESNGNFLLGLNSVDCLGTEIGLCSGSRLQ